MRVTMMRNVETFPSKQMYPYLSLVKRKVAELNHNIDRRRWLVWLKWHIFITVSGQLMVSLRCHKKCISHKFQNRACPLKSHFPITRGKKWFKWASSISNIVGDTFFCYTSYYCYKRSHFVALTRLRVSSQYSFITYFLRKKASILRIWKSFNQLPLLTFQARIPQGFYSESKLGF